MVPEVNVIVDLPEVPSAFMAVEHTPAAPVVHVNARTAEPEVDVGVSVFDDDAESKPGPETTTVTVAPETAFPFASTNLAAT